MERAVNKHGAFLFYFQRSPISSADLGGSSCDSSENTPLEGLRGEGFREQVNPPRLSRMLCAKGNLPNRLES